jgi:hypothetical protein
MKILQTLIDSIPVLEGEDYSISSGERKILLRERIRYMLLDFAVYTHPRKSLEEVQAIRKREHVLTKEPDDIPTIVCRLYDNRSNVELIKVSRPAWSIHCIC